MKECLLQACDEAVQGSKGEGGSALLHNFTCSPANEEECLVPELESLTFFNEAECMTRIAAGPEKYFGMIPSTAFKQVGIIIGNDA